jgi:hypothetical protein
MDQNKTELLEKTHIRLLYLGILTDIFAPLIIFFIVVFFREKLIRVQNIERIELLFYVFLILSLGEIGAIFIFRKKFWQSFIRKKAGHRPLAGSPVRSESVSNPQFFGEQKILGFGMVVYALCFTPTLYGLVYYLLGGTWERFSLFVAVTFLLFQLFKPKQEELEKLIEESKITV